MTDLADAAFRRAAAKVILKAKQTGTPVIVWDRGEVRAIPPEEVPDPYVDDPEAPDPGIASVR